MSTAENRLREDLARETELRRDAEAEVRRLKDYLARVPYPSDLSYAELRIGAWREEAAVLVNALAYVDPGHPAVKRYGAFCEAWDETPACSTRRP